LTSTNPRRKEKGLLPSYSRQLAIALTVAAGLVVSACGSGSSGSKTSSSGAAISRTSSGTPATSTYSSARATVIGKSTDVRVNRAVLAALRHAGIATTAVAPATGMRTMLFPVSSGQIVVSTLAGTVDHTGGLAFRCSGKSVMLTNFVINTSTKQLTATVGRRSMPIFDLIFSLPMRARAARGTVVASRIKLTVTSRAATHLNSSLDVRTFKAGMNFGTAKLILKYARGRRGHRTR
jgi:hypothetical protein